MAAPPDAVGASSASTAPVASVPIAVTPPFRPPQFAFRWNGELRLSSEAVGELEGDKHDSGNDGTPASASTSSPPPLDRVRVYEGVRCCTQVLIKVIPRSLADGAAIDFNIRLSAAIENEQRLMSGMVHMLQTLTCHVGRPGDGEGDPYYYVALEHCDMNLGQAIERTNRFLRALMSASPPAPLAAFDEDAAPLALWRARRSVSRQLVSAVAFLHRTGIGIFRRLFHNNLKPSNVLLKNGIVKLSELGCYSYSDGFGWLPDRVPSTHATPTPAAADSASTPWRTPLPGGMPAATPIAVVPTIPPVGAGHRRRPLLDETDFSVPRLQVPMLVEGNAAQPAIGVAEAAPTAMPVVGDTLAGLVTEAASLLSPPNATCANPMHHTLETQQLEFVPAVPPALQAEVVSLSAAIQTAMLGSTIPPPTPTPTSAAPAPPDGVGTAPRASTPTPAGGNGVAHGAPMATSVATTAPVEVSATATAAAPATVAASTPPLASLTTERGMKAALNRLYRLRAYGDCFALGCLVYYTLTLGKHPYGYMPPMKGYAGDLTGAGAVPTLMVGALATTTTPHLPEGAPTATVSTASATAGPAPTILPAPGAVASTSNGGGKVKLSTAARNVLRGALKSRSDISASLAAASTMAGVVSKTLSDALQLGAVMGPVGAAAPAPPPPTPFGLPSGHSVHVQVPSAIPSIPTLHLRTGRPPINEPAEPRASHMDAGDQAAHFDLVARAREHGTGTHPNTSTLRIQPVGNGRPRVDSMDATPAWGRDGSGVTASSSTDSGSWPDIPRAHHLPPLHNHVRLPTAATASPGGAGSGNAYHHYHHVSVLDTVDYEEGADLVHGLIDPNPDTRLTPADALSHPFFWSAARKFLFIQTVSESTVVNGDRAGVEHAAFAASLQARFLARMPPGQTSWGPLFPPPPRLGPSGWSSPLWHHRPPIDYERNYFGPFNMYSLVRFTRNFYVHGPEHLRDGLFDTPAALEAYLLTCWPWMVIELWRVDMEHGGKYTALALAGGGTVTTAVSEGGVDADVDVLRSQPTVPPPEPAAPITGGSTPTATAATDTTAPATRGPPPPYLRAVIAGTGVVDAATAAATGLDEGAGDGGGGSASLTTIRPRGTNAEGRGSSTSPIRGRERSRSPGPPYRGPGPPYVASPGGGSDLDSSPSTTPRHKATSGGDHGGADKSDVASRGTGAVMGTPPASGRRGRADSFARDGGGGGEVTASPVAHHTHQPPPHAPMTMHAFNPSYDDHHGGRVVFTTRPGIAGAHHWHALRHAKAGGVEVLHAHGGGLPGGRSHSVYQERHHGHGGVHGGGRGGGSRRASGEEDDPSESEGERGGGEHRRRGSKPTAPSSPVLPQASGWRRKRRGGYPHHASGEADDSEASSDADGE